MVNKLVFLFLILGSFSSCVKDDVVPYINVPDLASTPMGFPQVIYPEGNEFSYDRWLLGKKLFYDPVLSIDGKVSCASCHKADLAFSDDVPFSLGSMEALGLRNAPSLANVAYHPYYTREGGVPTLEMQVLVPIQEHNEFNNNIVLIADSIKKIDAYTDLSIKAYNRIPDAFVITRALANFERTLISGQSSYDFENTYKIQGSMSASALRGQALFESEKTQCNTCHSGFNFTNYAFENNGLYTEYLDMGRARLTQKDEDIALFKVPSLRNIAMTAPYMHDGSLRSLDEVIEHYNSGGKNHKNKNPILKALNLSDQEKIDLKSFLKALTDENFINNKSFRYE